MLVPIVAGAPGMVPKCLEKGLEQLESEKEMTANYSIVKIAQNTKKSPRDLSRLAFTQSPVKADQLKEVWKTCKERAL